MRRSTLFGIDRYAKIMEAVMSSSQIYLLGFIILTIGLATAAYMLSVPTLWIAVGVVVLIGIGVMATSNRSGPGEV